MDRLMEEIAKELTVDMIPDGIWRALAEEIGAYNVIKVMEMINGDSVYVPKPDRTLIPARDAMIKREFNGYNFESLSKKYGLTKNHIRTICGDGHIEGQCSIFQL